MHSDAYTKDFFVVNRWILKFAGVWQPESPNRIVQFLYALYAIGIFLFVNLYFTATEFFSLYYTCGNQYDLIKNLSFALTHLMGAVKVIFFYYRGDRVIRIMKTLESLRFHYLPHEGKHFHPELLSKQYKNTGIRWTILYFMLAHATLSSSYIPPTIATISHSKGIPGATLPEKLPYYSWMPFTFDTDTTYLIALGYQAIPMFSYAYSVVGMDTLFMNLMNCIALNLDIIQGAFLTVTDRAFPAVTAPSLVSGYLHNTEVMRIALRKEMKKICDHLQTVYRVCEELEKVHKYLTLAQTVATLFILCSCLYLVSMTPINSKQFLAEIVYMIAMGFQLVLYCLFGNEVTLKADQMPLYIWQSDWLKADRDFKRAMIFTMARCKRGLYLTAGDFVPLTLSTFLAVIKASYSFYTVIKKTSE